ncbi:MAG: 1-acyl-sn-glycerol-3-phosphate acyltransferase [Betaproteobacteria bacterium]
MATDSAPEPMRVIAPTVTTDRGNALARCLLRVVGWRVIYHGTPPGCGVIIAYPHTSNWDFVVGIVAKWAVGIPVAILSKDSLFRLPVLGRFMRACGCIPVNRSSPNGVIADMAERIVQASSSGERWWLAITPEGTRKRSEDGWRSGFYHIAVAAQVPIGLAYLNFQRKEIGVITFLQPSGNPDADMPQIARWYAEHAVGRHPELATPIRLKRSR